MSMCGLFTTSTKNDDLNITKGMEREVPGKQLMK